MVYFVCLFFSQKDCHVSILHKCIWAVLDQLKDPRLAVFSKARGHWARRPALRAHSPCSAYPIGIIFIDSVCSLLSLLEMTTNSVPSTMASVFTAPLWDMGWNIKGLQCAALPIIFQFKHCLTAVVSRLIYTVAFVGDRDHCRVNTEKKHIRAWTGNGREGDTAQRSSQGQTSLTGKWRGHRGRGTPGCSQVWVGGVSQVGVQWHRRWHPGLHYVVLKCYNPTFLWLLK